MNKIQVFLMRLKDASFQRMRMHIVEIHKESGRLSLSILIDMLWCAFRYGVGYLDYHVFGFAYVRGKKKRQSFMTMNDNLGLVRRVNQQEFRCWFDDKLKFLSKFERFTGREHMDLTQATAEDFEMFIKKHNTVFAKPVDDFGGHGIRKIVFEDVTDYPALHKELIEQGSTLVEEGIRQHPELSALNPTSINTIRMVTILHNEESHHMYSLIRVGDGSGVVDNISSGGMYAPVWEDGKIAKPAFCDATGLYYDKHPYTNIPFAGFNVPCYDEAVELVRRAAFVVPEIQYVGWDVAISEDGPLLVEGNVIPGYDMCQNYHHLRDDKKGIREKFERFL